MLAEIRKIIGGIYPQDWNAGWLPDTSPPKSEVIITCGRGKGKIPDVMQALESRGFTCTRLENRVYVKQGDWEGLNDKDTGHLLVG